MAESQSGYDRGKDYSHRDLCSATSGLLEAFLDMSENQRSDLDKETVERITEAFKDAHEKHGAETPLPDLD